MDRNELHRRVELLKSKMQEGKFHVAEHLAQDFEKSILKVRLAPDGLVDPDTVDSKIRSILNFVAYQNDREEWKDAISLEEIQSKYFEGLEYCFGHPYQMMEEAKADPYIFSKWFSSDPDRVAETIPTLTGFVESVFEFWENISEPTWIHLEDNFSSKAVFGGELFPNIESNIASSTGIYFDTTILPDPFIKIGPLLNIWDDKTSCYNILRLGLQVLKYKSIVLSGHSVPIVAILPDRHHFDENYREFINYCAKHDRLVHSNRLFNQKFSEDDELKDFLLRYTNAEELVSKLVVPQELVFATEWEGDLVDHIHKYLKSDALKLNISTPGEAVYMQLWSRFSQANDFFQRSKDLRGTPIIHAETSWLWFSWMLRNNSKRYNIEENTNLHIARALTSTAKTEISWLGNVPEKALIEIRKQGAMEEIRQILGANLTEIIESNPNNFFRSSDKIVENIQEALQKHEERIKDLKTKKWKFAGYEIGSFVVVGGIEIAAAITGLPIYGGLAAAAGMSGLMPNAKDIKTKFESLRDEAKKTNSTGLGILMKHKK